MSFNNLVMSGLVEFAETKFAIEQSIQKCIDDFHKAAELPRKQKKAKRKRLNKEYKLHHWCLAHFNSMGL